MHKNKNYCPVTGIINNKQKIPEIITVFSLALLLISCGGVTRNISSGQFSKTEHYEIKSYGGCCGCSAEYFDIYKGRKRQEQIVYRYNCYAPGLPTKFIFIYNRNGDLRYCEKFVAATADDFQIALTDYEKSMFDLVGKNKSIQLQGGRYVNFSDIKGFKKPTDQDVTHSFPLIRGGTRIKIR